MNITFKATALEFEVTGEHGEVIASHKAEHVSSSLDVRALLSNFSALAHLFKSLDATHREVAVDAAQADYAAQQAPAAPRVAAFYDAIRHVCVVAREEGLATDKFGALCEHADRLLAQPDVLMNDLVSVTFDLFDAQRTTHWDSPRMQVAMKAMSDARRQRGR